MKLNIPVSVPSYPNLCLIAFIWLLLKGMRRTLNCLQNVSKGFLGWFDIDHVSRLFGPESVEHF